MSAELNHHMSNVEDNTYGPKTIREPARDVHIFKEADVVVVGGGPAGIAAAVASARNGAQTILLERYGHLGGLASGGLVTLIMPMSDGTNTPQIAGICQEVIDRLDAAGAALHPRMEDLGSSKAELVDYWRTYSFCVIDGKIRLSVFMDPEILKCILNDMAEEAGVKLLLHSLFVNALVDNDIVKGVVFESKSGRQALLGKVVIDTTGDGDVYASAGAPFDGKMNSDDRSSKLAFVFRIGNIDPEKYFGFKKSNPQTHDELLKELESLRGFSMFIRTSREDVIWVNNNVPYLSGLSVDDLTRLEVDGRHRMRLTHDFLKKQMPGFENSFIIDTASQIGVRCSRRLIGEYVVTASEICSGVVFPDTIMMGPDFRYNFSPEHPHWHIPYRSLVPRKVKNMLAAGRCISTDTVTNDLLAPIQYCFATGQAAGTAAAIAVKDKVNMAQVDIKKLQKRLSEQKVPLPDEITKNWK
jgi:2-polyprenyl-6-methoxyphenol hydroxylase-like FAD-dependent oxidoreductase